MIAQNNVTTMLVGKDLDLLPAGGTRDSLAIGQIGVFKVGSKVSIDETTPLAAGDRFQIVTKKADGTVISTQAIEYNSISGKYAVEYTAPTYKQVAVGYNGVSGSIDVANYTNYTAHIFWNDNSKTMGYGKPVKFGTYYSSASATQVEIADGLVSNLNKNAKRENPQIISAVVILDEAGAVITGTGTLTVVNGSKYVTAGTNADAVYSVGDYFRSGTTVSDPAYKIVAIDTVNNILTLDTEYQGADAVAAEASAEIITAAQAAAAEAGVLLTALDTSAGFEPGVIRYDVTDFNVSLQDEFGATDLTTLEKSSVGVGTYYEVAYNEWFLKGNTMEPWRVGNYPKESNLEATSGETYDQISCDYADSNAKTIDRRVESFGTVLIATEDASAGAVHANLKTILGIA